MKNKIILKTIEEMYEIDQSLRKKAGSGGKLNTYNYLIYMVDLLHNQRIKNLIKKIGYPTKVKVGDDILFKFWLLIQHQDNDIQLQKECLKKCDFNPKEKTYLTDRILIKEGGKQKYGTQRGFPVKDRRKISKKKS